MDDPYAELARVKARIAEMERYATAAPPLEASIADHYSPLKPVDPARRRLESVARGFVPDPGMEDALAARARDPKFYDAEARRVGMSDGLERALYTRQRSAAIAVGAFTEPTPEGAPS